MVLRVLIFPSNILLNQAETAHIAHSLRPRCLADGVRGFCPFQRRDPRCTPGVEPLAHMFACFSTCKPSVNRTLTPRVYTYLDSFIDDRLL